MMAKPQRQHEWLNGFLGEWTSEMEVEMGPGKPTDTSRGTESVRSIGGLWIVAVGQAQMPGGTQGEMILTLGFDPQKNCFVGTWIGSMMANMWVYEGTLTGDTLVLNTRGPHMTDPGKLTSYRETIEIKSPDYRTFSSAMQGEDGEWMTFMTAHYRRVK